MVFPEELKGTEKIKAKAAEYPYKEDDERIQEIMRIAVNRKTDAHPAGYLTRDELREVCQWKSSGFPWNDGYVLENTEDEVKERSGKAFADNDLRHLFPPRPKGLRGVGLKTATAIMHFVFTKEYPIIDRKALLALGVGERNVSFKLWLKYQKHCIKWAEFYKVRLRILDRALWQLGDEILKKRRRC